MSRVGHSVWLPPDLDVLVKNHAAALGLSYNNIVIDALHQKFGIDRDPLSELMQDIRMWLLSRYDRTSFPPDVILQTFLFIQNNPKLFGRYHQILSDGRSIKVRAALNRRIGQAVHRILGGRVSKKRMPATAGALIKAYSILEPA